MEIASELAAILDMDGVRDCVIDDEYESDNESEAGRYTPMTSPSYSPVPGAMDEPFIVLPEVPQVPINPQLIAVITQLLLADRAMDRLRYGDTIDITEAVDAMEVDRPDTPSVTTDIQEDPSDISGEGCLTCTDKIPRIRYECGHMVMCGTCDKKVCKVAEKDGVPPRCIMCRAERGQIVTV